MIHAVIRIVAQVRKRLKASMPELGRGRPSSLTRKVARHRKRLEKKISDLFDNRHLFVKHHLAASEKKTLNRITRGLPHLRTLRDIMDEVYRLFDRCCRTDTALEKPNIFYTLKGQNKTRHPDVRRDLRPAAFFLQSQLAR